MPYSITGPNDRYKSFPKRDRSGNYLPVNEGKGVDMGGGNGRISVHRDENGNARSPLFGENPSMVVVRVPVYPGEGWAGWVSRLYHTPATGRVGTQPAPDQQHNRKRIDMWSIFLGGLIRLAEALLTDSAGRAGRGGTRRYKRARLEPGKSKRDRVKKGYTDAWDGLPPKMKWLPGYMDGWYKGVEEVFAALEEADMGTRVEPKSFARYDRGYMDGREGREAAATDEDYEVGYSNGVADFRSTQSANPSTGATMRSTPENDAYEQGYNDAADGVPFNMCSGPDLYRENYRQGYVDWVNERKDMPPPVPTPERMENDAYRDGYKDALQGRTHTPHSGLGEYTGLQYADYSAGYNDGKIEAQKVKQGMPEPAPEPTPAPPVTPKHPPMWFVGFFYSYMGMIGPNSLIASHRHFKDGWGEHQKRNNADTTHTSDYLMGFEHGVLQIPEDGLVGKSEQYYLGYSKGLELAGYFVDPTATESPKRSTLTLIDQIKEFDSQPSAYRLGFEQGARRNPFSPDMFGGPLEAGYLQYECGYNDGTRSTVFMAKFIQGNSNA
jgi:hypothetical protein